MKIGQSLMFSIVMANDIKNVLIPSPFDTLFPFLMSAKMINWKKKHEH